MSKKYTILLVDDNKHFLEAFKFKLNEVLENKIQTIDTALNGLECIAAIDKKAYDYVFMDIDMPLMNGIEATKKIADKFRYINVIAVSFHNDMEVIQEMIEAGARNYLIKEEINSSNLKRIFNF